MSLRGETGSLGLGRFPRKLDGRYELAERIGTGGMAEVWRARDSRLDRDVAVKMVSPSAAKDASRRRRMEREARALAAADHPNIVSVYDYGEAPGEDGDVVPFVVMEFVDGPDLDSYLAERGPLQIEEARELIAGILAGVARAHAVGVVHGDLKPANVFMHTHGPKVGDFGVARILDQETGTTTVAATPSFAAPEVLRGERATPASDVYSAGCLAYELLAGHPPFSGANAWEVASKHLETPAPKIKGIRSDVPADVEQAIERAMDKNPKRRFGDAQAFAAAIGPASSDPAPTVAVGAPVATGPEPTEAITKPRTDPAKIAVFGPFAGLGVRMSGWARTSPRRSVWLLAAAVLLVLLAFLAMRETGPETVTVPDVIGDRYQEAAAELRLTGFKVDVSFRPITEGEPGLVIDTIPDPTDEIVAGGEIHLIAGAIAQTPAPVVEQKGDDDDDGGDNDGRGEREGKGKKRRG